MSGMLGVQAFKRDQRQKHADASAACRRASHVDQAAFAGHDVVHGGESEPGALAGSFGGEEGLGNWRTNPEACRPAWRISTADAMAWFESSHEQVAIQQHPRQDVVEVVSNPPAKRPTDSSLSA
jgi:hypothetical protein